MPKPKFVKPLLIGCACAIPVGLVVGLSVNWDHRQFISSVGSSGVKPFIEAFGKEYTKINPKIDVQVESGGTTFAIEEIAKGFTNVGNASNNPYYSINKENGGYRDKWENKKTFTLGFEGLAILYKLPDGLSKEAVDNFDIVISKDNILDLYAVFSAFNETVKDGKWNEGQTQYKSSMLRYMTDESISHLSLDDIDVLLKTPIIPFVRSGGNTAANSSIAFTYYSHLADFEDMTENQQNAFRGGQYGNDRLYYETEESNSRAWEMFSKLNKPGSMVYLTSSFFTNENNRKMITDAGYKLAGYLSDEEGATPVHLNTKDGLQLLCKSKGFNWYRPINCMIDLNKKESTDFIEWIYSDLNLYNSLVTNNGAKPLTAKQMDSMLGKDGEFFSKAASDLELEKDRAGKEYAKVYGAADIWE